MKHANLISVVVFAAFAATSASADIEDNAGSLTEAQQERVYADAFASVCAMPLVQPAIAATAPDGSIVLDRVVALTGIPQSSVAPKMPSQDVARC